jgi:hypothetical protein
MIRTYVLIGVVAALGAVGLPMRTGSAAPFPAFCSGDSQTSAVAVVDDSCVPLPARLDGDTASFGSEDAIAVGGASGGLIRAEGTGDTDPFIAFAISATDLGSPSEFAFLFTIPIVPLTGPATVHAELGITITNGSPSPGVSIDPGTIAPAFIMSNNVGACAAGVDVGSSFSTPTTDTQSFVADGIFPPSAGCDSSISVLVNFTGTGDGDNYGLTGRFEVTQLQVPEPTTLALLGMGLLAIAAMGTRRRTM